MAEISQEQNLFVRNDYISNSMQLIGKKCHAMQLKIFGVLKQLLKWLNVPSSQIPYICQSSLLVWLQQRNAFKSQQSLIAPSNKDM